jgi:hypothetical protein
MAGICFDINTQYAIFFADCVLAQAAPYFLYDGALDRTFIQKFNRNTVAALQTIGATVSAKTEERSDVAQALSLRNR